MGILAKPMPKPVYWHQKNSRIGKRAYEEAEAQQDHTPPSFTSSKIPYVHRESPFLQREEGGGGIDEVLGRSRVGRARSISNYSQVSIEFETPEKRKATVDLNLR